MYSTSSASSSSSSSSTSKLARGAVLLTAASSVLYSGVNAAPISDSPVLASRAEAESSYVRLPLKRHVGSSTVPGHVRHAQLANRGLLRAARMMGTHPPSQNDMINNVARRMDSKIDGKVALVRRQSPSGDGNADNSTTAYLNAVMQALESNSFSNSTVQTSNGTTGLNIISDEVSYTAVVSIGNPATQFNVIMDTGSSDFWVQGSQCQNVQTNQPCNPQHNTLGAQSSSTLSTAGKQFQDSYGSGAVAGQLVTDSIQIGGLTIPNKTFGVASMATDQFVGQTSLTDGLMGLGQPSLSNQKQPTPIEALASAGLVSNMITSFVIPRLPTSGSSGQDGEVQFGGMNPSLFQPSTLVELPVTGSTGFWEAAIGDISVNGQKLPSNSARVGIFDTGTTLAMGPEDDVTALYQGVPGAQALNDGSGGFTVPCDTNASVAFTFGGQSFSLSPQDLAFTPAQTQQSGGGQGGQGGQGGGQGGQGGLGGGQGGLGGLIEGLLGGNSKRQNGGQGQSTQGQTCMGGIVAMPSQQGGGSGQTPQAGTPGGSGTWLLGDVFLRNVFFSTNLANNTVALAKLAQ